MLTGLILLLYEPSCSRTLDETTLSTLELLGVIVVLVTHPTDLSLLLSAVALLLLLLLLQLFPLNLQFCVLHLQLSNLRLYLCRLLGPMLELGLRLLQGGLCPRSTSLDLLDFQVPLLQTALEGLLGVLLRSQTILQFKVLLLLACKFF